MEKRRNLHLMPITILKFREKSGSALIFVLVLTVIASLVMGAVMLSSRYSLKRTQRNQSSVSALNVAEAGKERVLAELRERTLKLPNGGTQVLYSNESVNANPNTGTYSVRCSTWAAIDTAILFAVGVKGNERTEIEVTVYVDPEPWQRWLKGMVTSKIDVSTLGNIEIDGRDYDSIGNYGNLLGTGGIFGVASGGTVSVGGSSLVGGTSGVLSQPGVPGVTVAQYMDTTGYPQTPEQLLGLSPNALRPYWVTSSPPSNFVGIVCANRPYDFAGGIMIVHDTLTGTASLGNYHNHFKGLIIADQVNKFNGGSSVLGAIFMLGSTAGSHTFGNGNARLHYSSQMLQWVFNRFLPAPPGRRTVNVLSWREIR